MPQDTETHRQAPKAAAPRPRAAPPPSAVDARRAAASSDPLLTEPFQDDFERPQLGGDWHATSAAWRMENGALCVERARNHPLWLKRRLPVNARVEFEAVSHSAAGDIKAEVWGNGFGNASAVSYSDASSYLAIFGGWNNQFHVLARLDEHAKTRKEVRVEPSSTDLRTARVKQGETYRFKIERSDGKAVSWWVNDVLIHTYADEKPLMGAGHEHFGFNDWDARLCFDNLRITPLP
ncbi:MAG: hypothetical protein KIT72_16840 [Polyangiaceae bacterium]|nr:hypothetical protein [Polyangiaceae bacterium]MCW5792086.1 hypothetical protein [Polyangiaceae bacterium]